MSLLSHPRKPIRIGTRRSPLALAQAEMVKRALVSAHPHLGEPEAVTLVPMTTTGDTFLQAPLSEIGGKGLFTKELEEALLQDHIDIAVHSAKDMQTILPDGLEIGCTLKREDARDVLIGAASVTALPQNAVVGTASLRRAVQVKQWRTDITIVPFRGNVQTRLRKLEAKEVDATLLAAAGLKRLGIHPEDIGAFLSLKEFIPAVGQGIIAIECRANDKETKALLASIHHAESAVALHCERALLRALDGSCRTPIAGYATVTRKEIHLSAMLATADGSASARIEMKGDIREQESLGRKVAEELKRLLA